MTKKTPVKRTDALRNRERVLQAAREAFAGGHAEVSMAEIIRRSGVGSATLYRNFPSRRELLEAILDEELTDVCDAASTIAGDTAEARLTAWLRQLSDYVASKRPVVIELLEHVERTDTVLVTGRDRVLAAGAPLFAAAQEAGEITVAISLDQILDLIAAIAKIPCDADHREPILDVALAGLRRSATRDRSRPDVRGD
jgi:AcrR family transcriptional regulator